jgi:hypothetical protein
MRCQRRQEGNVRCKGEGWVVHGWLSVVVVFDEAAQRLSVDNRIWCGIRAMSSDTADSLTDLWGNDDDWLRRSWEIADPLLFAVH